MLERVFKITEKGSTVRTEIVAGLTTFMTMAYIIALNPNMLTNFDTGSPMWNGIFLSTCVAPFIGMMFMAFYANSERRLPAGAGSPDADRDPDLKLDRECYRYRHDYLFGYEALYGQRQGSPLADICDLRDLPSEILCDGRIEPAAGCAETGRTGCRPHEK